MFSRSLITNLVSYFMNSRLLKNSLSLYISWYNLVSLDFWVADYKFEVKKSKFEMADPI